MSQVSTRIREAREKSGVSQAKLGKVLGVDRKTISRYEKGTHEPTAGDLRKIAATVGVDAGWLLTGARKPESGQAELPDDVVLVVRYPDTGKVWWAAKLSLQVQVYERLEFVGGEGSNKLTVETEGLVKRTE